MPLSKEKFEKIKADLCELNILKHDRKEYLNHESIIWVLEQHMECDAHTVQGDPNTSKGRAPAFTVDDYQNTTLKEPIMSACGEWIKIKGDENLPKPYEKVLARFVHAGSRLHFVAWVDEKKEWNLYYLYTSYPVDKNKLIPTHWAEIIEVKKENSDG